MESYKVGQKIYRIDINHLDKDDRLRPEGIHVENLEILGISKHKICLNDDWFTTFYHHPDGSIKDRSIYNYLDDISVSIKTREKYFANGVFITLFSTKKPSKKLYIRMVAKACLEIDNRYGFLMKGAKDGLWNMIESN